MNAPANISYEDRLKAAAKARRARLGFGRAIKSADEEKRHAASGDQFRPYQARFMARSCPRWMVEDIEFDEHVRAFKIFRSISKPRVIDLQRKRKPRQIKEEVANLFHGVTVEEMESISRRVHIVAARQIAMYLMRTELGLSLPQIGRHFGGRDHTSVLYSVTKVEAFIKNNGGDLRNLANYGSQFDRRAVVNDILSGKSREAICKAHGITRMQYQTVKQTVQKDMER